MATGDRSKKILGKVQLSIVGSINKVSKFNFNIPETVIYDIIGDYATKIAQELFCLETSSTLTVSSSTVSEPTGFLKFKQIQLDTSLLIQPVELDVEEYDRVSRSQITDWVQTPLYYKRWGGTITFFPAVTSASYTAYWYKIPTTTPSSSIDPETSAQYDKAIEYGVVMDVATMAGRNDLNAMYEEKYQRELEIIETNRSRTDTVPLEVSYNGMPSLICNTLPH